MVRRSIYDTRRPEHPHLPIGHYERCPQVPALRPRHMESYLFHGHTTSTSPCISAAVVITTNTPPHYKPTHLIHRRDPHYWYQQFCWSPFLTWFDSRFLIWLDSIFFWFDKFSIIILIWLDSIVVLIRLDSIIISIRFDSRLTYLFSTRVTWMGITSSLLPHKQG